MRPCVLIIEDDLRIAELLRFHFRQKGYEVECLHEGQPAIFWMRNNPADLVLLDLKLPDIEGKKVLESIKDAHSLPVIIMSAHADLQIAVECMKSGASDFIEKPFSFETLDSKVKRLSMRNVDFSGPRSGQRSAGKGRIILGKSRAMEDVFEKIHMAAESAATIFIEGESGTGKELVARAIHQESKVQGGPFVAVNCSAIPETLLEAELFGFEKGAFTGAVARKKGKVEMAHGGTLFFDEIGDLPVHLQVKLLRTLQEKEVERIGGTEVLKIHFRVVTASNRDIRTMVDEKRFREDLFYRIHVFPIRVPPLRERREDIPHLLEYFLRRYDPSEKPWEIGPLVMKQMMQYEWPGNVREMEHFAERMTLLHRGRKTISIQDLDQFRWEVKKPHGESGDWRDRRKVLAEAEKKLLSEALCDNDWNVSRVCRALGISRDTFYRKMKKFAIVRPRGGPSESGGILPGMPDNGAGDFGSGKGSRWHESC